MKKILTAGQMKEIDFVTTEKFGISSLDLMERAATEVFQVIKKKTGENLVSESFIVLCGKGNNGGDGAVLSRLLAEAGAWVKTYLLGKVEQTKGDARINFERLKHLAESQFFDEKLIFQEIEKPLNLINKNFYRQNEIIIDALFGTGLSRILEGDLGEFVKIFNHLQMSNKSKLIVSIDIPSGLNADSANSLGVNIEADLTITFTSPKKANCFLPAAKFNGETFVKDIGSPSELVENSPSKLFLSDVSDAEKWLKETAFSDDSYKSKRGSVLLVAGSRRYAGAGILAANASLQSGVGLVTLATPKSAYLSVSSRLFPEIMCLELEENEDGQLNEKAFAEISEFQEKTDVLALGCGLPQTSENNKTLFRQLIEKRKKVMILDAEILTALSPFEIEGNLTNPLILTPHEGEFARLLGRNEKLIGDERITVAQEFAQKQQIILVLKGEKTLIASPDGRIIVNPTGNSGLGKGGNGDTLTGIISGFVAQSVALERFASDGQICSTNSFEKTLRAVVVAVYMAGLAGDITEKEFGKRSMRATDVQKSLASVFKLLEK